jgi:predicted esterase
MNVPLPARLEAPDLVWRDAPMSRAKRVILTIHGRGATASGILDLADHLAMPDFTFLAPQAQGGSWYPSSFMAPTERNEPYLGQALANVAGLISAIEEAGFRSAQIGLMGFSQGACLALESAIRRPASYGAVLGFAGGLIGPPGTRWPQSGHLNDTPVLLACGDADHHIPISRVLESEEAFTARGARVALRIYPGFGHGINDDGIAQARRILNEMARDH